MRFEDIIPYLGDFGKFQKIQLFLLCLPIWVTGMHALAMTFLAAGQEHRCFVPGWDDFPNKTGSLNYSLIYPAGDDGGYDRCNMYAVNVTRGVWYTVPDNTTATVQCTQWVYDTSQYKTSIFSQFDMVCGRKYMNNLAQSMYMAGMLVGAVIFGDLSDRFGRKRLMFISQIIQVVSGIGLSFTPEYITFTILRFMLGAAHSGVFLPAFVIGMEFVTPKGRTMAGIMPHVAFAIGYCTLALSAYLIPYWNWVSFVIAVPDLFFLIYYWDRIIPGSARWHLQNGHKEKSKNIIKRAAKVNRKQIPTKVLDELEPDVKHNAHVIAMMRYPRMRIRGFIIFYNWWVQESLVLMSNLYSAKTHIPGLGLNLEPQFLLTLLTNKP